MKTFLRWDDSDGDFDPYDLSPETNNACINCGYEGSQELFVIKYNNKIYDLKKSPFQGRMDLFAAKENGELDTVNFTSTKNNYSPYDQLNALTTLENALDKLKHSLIESNVGNCFFSVNFSADSPFSEITVQRTSGFSYTEISAIVNNLKNTVLGTMTRQKLVTFNSNYDSRDGFYL